MILTVRVDERLIHGQVVTNWISMLRLTNIIVANDKAANDPIQKGALKMACPGGVKCLVATVDKAAEVMNDPRMENLRVMVVVETPTDALKIVKNVKDIPEVNIANIGNMYHPNAQKTVLFNTVKVEDVDLEAIKELKKLVPIYQQTTPVAAKQQFNML